MKTLQLLCVSLLVTLLIACKQDSSATDGGKMVDTLATAKKALEAAPNLGTARLYIDELKKQLKDSEDQQALLQEGLDVAEKYQMAPTAIGFLTPLLKRYPQARPEGEYLAKLASALHDMNRIEASQILASAYFDKYPEGKYAAALKAKMGSDPIDADQIITTTSKSVFENPDKYGINRTNAQKVVDVCEAYALAYPESENAAANLYKAGEMARTLRTYSKAISIYDWIQEKYPNYERTPTTLFLKGFMLENELNDKEAAKEVYATFLKKYPSDELADDVEFLLKNIDKTEEEIRKLIEQGGAQ